MRAESDYTGAVGPALKTLGDEFFRRNPATQLSGNDEIPADTAIFVGNQKSSQDFFPGLNVFPPKLVLEQSSSSTMSDDSMSQTHTPSQTYLSTRGGDYNVRQLHVQ